MSSASDVAAGFSISGLLDAGAKTRSKYPVAELDIDAYVQHRCARTT